MDMAHFSQADQDVRRHVLRSTGRVLLIVGSLNAAAYGLVEEAAAAETFDKIKVFEKVIALSSFETNETQHKDRDLLSVEYHDDLPNLSADVEEWELQFVWESIDLHAVTDVVFACITPFSKVRLEYVSYMLMYVKANSELRNCVILSNSGCLSLVNQPEHDVLHQSDITTALLPYMADYDKLMKESVGVKLSEVRYDIVLGPSFERDPTADTLSYLAHHVQCNIDAEKGRRSGKENIDPQDMDVSFPGTILSYEAKRSFVTADLAARYILLALHKLESGSTGSAPFTSISMTDKGTSFADIWPTICDEMGAHAGPPKLDEDSGWRHGHDQDMILKQAPYQQLPELAVFDVRTTLNVCIAESLDTMKAKGILTSTADPGPDEPAPFRELRQ